VQPTTVCNTPLPTTIGYAESLMGPLKLSRKIQYVEFFFKALFKSSRKMSDLSVMAPVLFPVLLKGLLHVGANSRLR